MEISELPIGCELITVSRPRKVLAALLYGLGERLGGGQQEGETVVAKTLLYINSLEVTLLSMKSSEEIVEVFQPNPSDLRNLPTIESIQEGLALLPRNYANRITLTSMNPAKPGEIVFDSTKQDFLAADPTIEPVFMGGVHHVSKTKGAETGTMRSFTADIPCVSFNPYSLKLNMLSDDSPRIQRIVALDFILSLDSARRALALRGHDLISPQDYINGLAFVETGKTPLTK